jgi:hypothetical protein
VQSPRPRFALRTIWQIICETSWNAARIVQEYFLKTICPSCSAEAHIILTAATRKQFCPACADKVCPSFLSGSVLSMDDVRFLSQCGTDPEIQIMKPQVRVR